MTRPLLLLSCSLTTNWHAAPAREYYCGRLFRIGLKLAEKLNYRCLILSAKHGWVTPDTLIHPYNARFTKRNTYDGPWPKGSGFYLGGRCYFGKAPARFKPIVAHSGGHGRGGCGHIFSRAKQLLAA